MNMRLTPMLLLGLECTECGQLLSKPEDCATDGEIIEVGVACGAIDPNAVRFDRCRKCGQLIRNLENNK